MSRRPTYAHHSATPSPAPVLIPNPSTSAGYQSGRSSPFYGAAPNAVASGSRQALGLGPGAGLKDRETYSESPYGGMGRSQEYSKTAHQLEGQNDDKLAGLMGKVKLLKDISIGIGDEVRQSNMELGSMNDAFSSTSTFLGGTFKRMNAMAKKQGGNWCWLMLFLLLVLWIFVVVWFLRR